MVPPLTGGCNAKAIPQRCSATADVIIETAWLRTHQPEYLDLAKRWARGTAILFAVGAVSGTVLSFELGLLWPVFMAFAGPIIGMPFSLEGFAFFLEAIFLGLYLYGWDRLRPSAHVFAGVVVAVSGALSGAFVVTVNAWMNTPAGFRVVNGVLVEVDPFVAMFNPAAGAQVVHMLLAAYCAVGIGVAGIHARLLVRDPSHPFHRRAFAIALLVGMPAALAQPLSGDRAGKMLARTQPAKLAALEGHFHTSTYAPLRIGGIPDLDAEETRYSIDIPGGLSLLAYGDPHHEWLWGRVFAVASTVTPLFLGVILGAVRERRLPETHAGSFADVFIAPWLTPFSLSVGVFALTLFAFLAAVYLTLEARDPVERAAFRARALVSGGLVGVLAAIVLVLAEPGVRSALTASPWAIPLHVATGVSAITSFACLWVERYRLARVAAAAQVTLILWGWALAQYPYAIRPHLTLAAAAAPENILVILLQVLGAGAVLLVPSLLYLFGIFGPRGHGAYGEQSSQSH